MGEERQSAEAIEPMLERAVGDAAVAAQGANAIGDLLESTESEVASILRAAEQDAARMAAESERRVEHQLAERREELARLRQALTERASVLAVRFETILDLLEDAEAELGGERDPSETERVRAIRMTLRERHRISFSHEQEAPAVAAVAAIEGEATDEKLEGPSRRRRWWQRWLREAA